MPVFVFASVFIVKFLCLSFVLGFSLAVDCYFASWFKTENKNVTILTYIYFASQHSVSLASSFNTGNFLFHLSLIAFFGSTFFFPITECLIENTLVHSFFAFL